MLQQSAKQTASHKSCGALNSLLTLAYPTLAKGVDDTSTLGWQHIKEDIHIKYLKYKSNLHVRIAQPTAYVSIYSLSNFEEN